MWARFSLRTKLLFTGTILAFVPLAVVMSVVIFNESRMSEVVNQESGRMALTDLDHIATSVAALASTHSDLTAKEGYEKLRHAIMDIKIGETGYVYVLSTKGEYLISKDGKRDGENIWGAKDTTGRLFHMRWIIEDLGHHQVAMFGIGRFTLRNENAV